MKYLIIILIAVLGLAFFISQSGSGIGGSFSGAGVTNTVIVVGKIDSVTSTVLSAGDVSFYAKICNNGIGEVTICYAANCVFDSGISLASSTNNLCHEISEPNLYKGAISAAVNQTTTLSDTSTLGIIFR